MQVVTLSNNESAASGFTHKAIITHADLSGASTTATLEVFNVTAGSIVYELAWRIVTGFDASGDAAINSLTFEAGDGGNVDRLLDGADGTPQLAADGTEVPGSAAAQGWNTSTATLPYVYTAADTVDLVFTVAGGASPTIDELDSGEFELYARIVNVNDLAQG